ncbi:MAG: lysophospholipase [Solobacterium sp.]|nr:lysophospholipase [Solobacterium sp.]
MDESLAWTVYRPEEQEVKAAVFIIHGMEEHRRRYDAFANYLNSRGIGVVTYDLPGHGESADKADRGYFGDDNGWRNLVISALDISLLTKNAFKNVPLIMMGHSIGTIIARSYLQKYDRLIDGVILNGLPNYTPAAHAGKGIATFLGLVKGGKRHSKLLDRLVTGNFNSVIDDPRTPLDWLSTNEKNVDAYIDDDDCGEPFTIRGYYDLFDGLVRMNDVQSYNCTKPDMPIYVVAGEDDPVIGGVKGFNESIRLLQSAGYKNIGRRLYPHMRHETLNETESRVVWDDIADYILTFFC